MKIKKHLPVFRPVAIVIALATLSLWGIGGFHPGWTQTSIVETHFDEITEIDYPVRRNAFVAGVDVLAVGLVLSLGLAGISFLGHSRRG